MRDSRTQTNESLSFWPRCAKRLGVRCLGTALKRGKAASSRRTPQPSALFSEQATLSTRFGTHGQLRILHSLGQRSLSPYFSGKNGACFFAWICHPMGYHFIVDDVGILNKLESLVCREDGRKHSFT